ncbi:MAG TPA: hypothetical protein PLN79_15955 [bacterium]|nr:hypothetical protein [bacterium]
MSNNNKNKNKNKNTSQKVPENNNSKPDLQNIILNEMVNRSGTDSLSNDKSQDDKKSKTNKP